MWLEAIAQNIIADFLFILLVIVLGWILYSLTRRNQLLRFFGIDRSRRLVIYLSNLQVMSGGAIGIDGRPRSYQGEAAAFRELQVASRFRELFNYLVPSLADRPGILSRLLVSDVQVEISLSPLDQGHLERSSSFISLGSPGFNAASSFIEEEIHSQAHFQQVDNSHVMVITDVTPISDLTHGFVERVVDHDARRNIFYAAGISQFATVGAAHFLLTEWQRLYTVYGNDHNFVVMLRFEHPDPRQWTIVFQR